ncbi:MAG: hypothetical protein HGB26_00520 [Desulfobulbaceae bacterium]|nr:hypothetical protein [Desulfobulbaceae bacterium]
MVTSLGNTAFYEKAGLHRKLYPKAIQVLPLNEKEEILISIFLNTAKSSPEKIIPDIMECFLITSERLFVVSLKSHLKKTTKFRSAEVIRQVTIKLVIPICEIIKICFSVKFPHKQNKEKSNIFSPKIPVLTIETEFENHEILLKSLFRYKKKMPLVVNACPAEPSALGNLIPSKFISLSSCPALAIIIPSFASFNKL